MWKGFGGQVYDKACKHAISTGSKGSKRSCATCHPCLGRNSLPRGMLQRTTVPPQKQNSDKTTKFGELLSGRVETAKQLRVPCDLQNALQCIFSKVGLNYRKVPISQPIDIYMYRCSYSIQ